MVGASGIEALFAGGLVEEMALVGELSGERGPYGHDALMRAVHLVGREHVDVAAERQQIGQAVRRIGDAVDDGDGAKALGALDHIGDRVDLAHDVGSVREGDQRIAASIEKCIRNPVDGVLIRIKSIAIGGEL